MPENVNKAFLILFMGHYPRGGLSKRIMPLNSGLCRPSSLRIFYCIGTRLINIIISRFLLFPPSHGSGASGGAALCDWFLINSFECSTRFSRDKSFYDFPWLRLRFEYFFENIHHEVLRGHLKISTNFYSFQLDSNLIILRATSSHVTTLARGKTSDVAHGRSSYSTGSLKTSTTSYKMCSLFLNSVDWLLVL